MARPKSFDEDTALDAAAQLFWTKGYDGTCISDLEASMEMGRQSIYNAFGDKRALFLKALARYSRWNEDRLTASLLAPNTGLETIHSYFDGLVDFVTADGPRRGCLFMNSILEVDEGDVQVQARCQANQQQIVQGFEYALAKAVEAGDLPDSLDVGATARMLMSQTYGITVMSKAGASRAELAGTAQALLARLT